VDRDVGNHQIGDKQLLEHVGSNVALLYEFDGGAASQVGLRHCRANEIFFNLIKIDAAFCAEWTNDKNAFHDLHLIGLASASAFNNAAKC
jgi:hypothetical protein